MGITSSTTLAIFQAVLVSLVSVMLFASIGIRLASRIKLIDHPGSEPHKLHLHPTPLAGGIALAATILMVGIVFNLFDNQVLRAMLVASLPVFLFGLWDDFKPIPPALKLMGQLISAVLLIILGISIQIFESPEFFIRGSETINRYLDWFITIAWIIGITNAFNFVDSMDGLVVGLGGMSAAFFLLLTLDAGQVPLSIFSALLIGASVGLYFFNSQPALLFLGDSGAQLLGIIMASLAITYRPVDANQSSSWLVPILLLGVPIFDAALVILSRLRRRRPVYTAARDHTFHRLLSFGLDPNRAVLVMHIISMALGCLAFIVLKQPPLIANLTLLLVVILGILALFILERRPTQEITYSPEDSSPGSTHV